MRIVALILFSIAASGGGAALAQDEPAVRQRADDSPQQEAPEEVIVRGRRLSELRAEVELTRERAYGIFNDINGDDDFDIYCHEERRYHSRATERVCRARFEGRISSAAGQDYMSALRSRCPEGLTQDCMFSDYSSGAISAAQGVESEALGKRDQLTDEIFRLARDNDQFAQAILDWYEANQQYEAARKRRGD